MGYSQHYAPHAIAKCFSTPDKEVKFGLACAGKVPPRRIEVIGRWKMGSACALARPVRRPRRTAPPVEKETHTLGSAFAEAVFGEGAKNGGRGARATRFRSVIDTALDLSSIRL
jgi:hypothetical protein